MPLPAALVLGCGGDETEPPPTGEQVPTCVPPELALPDGSCIRPGIAPDDCYEGFVHDGEYGCEPILPPEPCPPGLMAVPGETECRPVMDCGEGTWGDLPTDGTTEHVDGSYAGGNSDGSAAAPWTTIGEAVAAAAPGALVAVAAGSYVEDVSISGKPVRLWGRCPERVELVGMGAELAAVDIRVGASGTEVGGIALLGAAAGLFLSGSEDVTFDRVWVHETASQGIHVEGALGPTSVSVVGSLVEQSNEIGLFLAGSDALVEGTVVRATLPRASDQESGRGINIQLSCFGGVCDPTTRANATLRGSLVEQNHDVGLFVTGSDVVVESTVVRVTLPQASDQRSGRGINIQACGTQSGCDPTVRASATVRGSLVEQNHQFGLSIMGSDALVESTVVRANLPRASDQAFGRGISIQLSCSIEDGCDPTARANATLRGSLVEQNHDVGLHVSGSDVLVEGTVVRATLPQASDQTGGRGINIQLSCIGGVCDPTTRANATVRGSLVEQSHDVGLAVAASDTLVEGTVVRATLPRLSDGFFGDGVAVFSAHDALASATITGALIADSPRAGLASFGAFVSLGSTRIQCAGYELEGEPFGGQDFVFEDRGGNGCGCPTADGVCVAESAGLAPPEPATP